jgi:type II secretory pathway pseudopilin PulG
MAIDASVLWRWIQVGVIVAIVLIAIALIFPAVEQSREAARQVQSRNNLKMLGLALQNYHEQFNRLPYGGTFDAHGTPFHGWTTALDMYLSQRAWYDAPDPNFPWDDPVNVDHIINERTIPFQNPSIPDVRSSDGLPLTHFAGNEMLFYRNSVVSLNDLPERGSTALLGDCNGDFPPLGYPFNWRDVSHGIGTSPAGFGCPVRDATMFLMADQSVRVLNNRADIEVVRTLAGPLAMKPTSEQVAKPSEPYRLKIRKYWRYLNIVRAHKSLMTFRLAPDQKYLHVDFRRYDDPEDAVPERWRSDFLSFIKDAPVEHVELEGSLRANELVPFLELPALKRLTIGGAKIADDKESILNKARKKILID